jgi:uncharacterized protein YegP (UPF0339 family)
MFIPCNKRLAGRYFHLKAKNGEVILSSSEGYVSEQGVKLVISYV